MEYTSIINLVLVTIIYSTFISPNLEKLGSIRDEIIDLNFPEYGNEDYNSELKKSGTKLSKMLTKYEDKYKEILQFLKYFYWIIGILFLLQGGIFYYSDDHSIVKLLNLLIAVIVVGVLILTLRKYMLPPWKIRSMQWLVRRGIAEVNISNLFKGKLVINQKTSNNEFDDEITSISIGSSIKLLGYRYIFLIENLAGERLYYVSSGTATKHLRYMRLIPRTGNISHDLNVAYVKLKRNNYRARLIIFNTAFDGKFFPFESSIEFAVGDESMNNPPEKINLITPSDRIEVKLKNNKIKHMTVSEGNSGDTSLVSLLTSKSFIRVAGNSNRPIILENYNGNLGRYEIDLYCSRRNAFARKLVRRFERKVKNRTYVNLVPKRKR